MHHPSDKRWVRFIVKHKNKIKVLIDLVNILAVAILFNAFRSWSAYFNGDHRQSHIDGMIWGGIVLILYGVLTYAFLKRSKPSNHE